MREFDLSSRLLGESRKLWHLDLTEGGSKRLGVFLDGELYFNRVDAPVTLKAMVDEKVIPPFHAVFVSNVDEEARHRDFVCQENYSRFLVEEVVEWARGEVPGLPEGGHLIAGISLSALAAAHTALEHPDVFSTALCQAPSAWWNNEWMATRVSEGEPSKTRFWISVGRQETEKDVTHEPGKLYQGTSQLDSCQRLVKAMSESGFEVEYRDYDGGHDGETWTEDFPHGLRWLMQ